MISVNAWALFITALVFTLVLVLKNLFFESLARAMAERKRRLDEAADLWDEARRSIGEADNTIVSAIQETRNEGYGLLDEARSEAQQTAQDELDEARLDAQKQIQEGRDALSRLADQAVKDLEQRADGLASEIASRILGREVA